MEAEPYIYLMRSLRMGALVVRAADHSLVSMMAAHVKHLAVDVAVAVEADVGLVVAAVVAESI